MVVKDPIRLKLLFLSPIRSRKGACLLKQDMGKGGTLNRYKYKNIYDVSNRKSNAK